MQSKLFLATSGGKGGLLLYSLGMAWGWPAWGSSHTDFRDARLWSCPGPQGVGLPGTPQKHQKNWLVSRNGGRVVSPWTLPSLWPYWALITTP